MKLELKLNRTELKWRIAYKVLELRLSCTASDLLWLNIFASTKRSCSRKNL